MNICWTHQRTRVLLSRTKVTGNKDRPPEGYEGIDFLVTEDSVPLRIIEWQWWRKWLESNCELAWVLTTWDISSFGSGEPTFLWVLSLSIQEPHQVFLLIIMLMVLSGGWEIKPQMGGSQSLYLTQKTNRIHSFCLSLSKK